MDPVATRRANASTSHWYYDHSWHIRLCSQVCTTSVSFYSTFRTTAAWPWAGVHDTVHGPCTIR